MTQPTHIAANGQPTMVDVGERASTRRQAVAVGRVRLVPEALAILLDGEILSGKGPVFATAIVAGTQAVKRTSDLIPFCHPIAVDSIKFSTTVSDGCAVVQCTVACDGRTGVEMEALTGASIACLTIYDMLKALGLGMAIDDIHLVSKSGGRRNWPPAASGARS